MLNNLRARIANLINPVKNSMNIAKEYLRYGAKSMTPDWTQVVMSDADLYTGYSYAAIRNRANMTARIAMEFVSTDSKKDGFEHPYLKIIENSPTFTDHQFWMNISTYLDLEGVYYLMVIRNFSPSKMGKIKEFKLLNPYNIRRVINRDNLDKMDDIHYVETRKGFVREIPKEMIIPMRELNPFDDDNSFSMTDAAKEAQFTIKTAGDYTRHTLKHNINSPGILSTDVILEPEVFKNFTERVKNATKGEPIFGNGKGAITWDSMNIELSKAALADVNEINREALFSIAGVSKTMMGIEQSGTTRETAKVQKDLMIESQTIPRIQLILDALNQDYRNNYPEEFAKDEADLVVNNPTATDHDAEIKDNQVKKEKVDLYNGLLAKGYDAKTASQYVKGEIDIDKLGEPKNPPAADTSGDDAPVIERFHIHHDQKKKNDKTSGLIQQQEGALQNAIVNLDAEIVATCIERIQRKAANDFESDTDVVTKKQEESFTNKLIAVLTGFYGIVFMLQGGEIMRDRVGQFALPGNFKLDKKSKSYIKQISDLVAVSHVSTIIDDVLVTARVAALEGKGQKEIVGLIKKKYNDTIVETRAKTIARTETNRAFTRAQFEADRQFIEQNKLKRRAFKQWTTRSANPCEYCQELEDRGEIPFDEAFADIGDDIVVGDKSMPVTFEDLEAGNAHPNCSCIYQLVIREE